MFLAANYMQGLTDAQTIHQRLGDIHSVNMQKGMVAPWAKVFGGKFEAGNNIDRNNLENASMDYKGIQFGIDRVIDAKKVAGIFGTYADQKSTFVDKDGAGSIKGNRYGLGAYLTMHNDKSYVDVVANINHVKTDIVAQMDGRKAAKANGVKQNSQAISIEYGTRFTKVDGKWMNMADSAMMAGKKHSKFIIEPQARLKYARFGSAEFTLSDGLRGQMNSYNSLVGSLGVHVEYAMQNANGSTTGIYAKAMYNHEFSAKPEITYNNKISHQDDYKGGYWTYGLGAHHKLANDVNIYGEVNFGTKNVLKEKYRYDIGIRFKF